MSSFLKDLIWLSKQRFCNLCLFHQTNVCCYMWCYFCSSAYWIIIHIEEVDIVILYRWVLGTYNSIVLRQLVSLMYHQYWFWYPPAVTVTSCYWFPGWLPQRNESRFPQRFDNEPEKQSPPVGILWAGHNASCYFFFLITFFYCSILKCCFKDVFLTLQSFLSRLLTMWLAHETLLRTRGVTELSLTWPGP